MALSKDIVTEALRGIAAPKGGNLIDAGIARAITVEPSGEVRFVMEIDPAEAEAMEAVLARAEAAIRALPGVTKVAGVLTAHPEVARYVEAAAEGLAATGVALTVAGKKVANFVMAEILRDVV